MDIGLTVSDPVTAFGTAALNAAAAYFNFLCTPEGQLLSADMRKLTWDRLVDLIPAKGVAK